MKPGLQPDGSFVIDGDPIEDERQFAEWLGILPDESDDVEAAWCNTGPGGGQDNSCPPGNKGEGDGGNGESRDRGTTAQERKEGGRLYKPKNMDQIFRLLSADNGFTFDPQKGDRVRKGFAVSVTKVNEKVLDKPFVGVQDLNDYWDAHADAWETPGNYMGGWVSNGNIVLDVAIVVDTEEEADRLGRDNDQDAIYDLANGKEIKLR